MEPCRLSLALKRQRGPCVDKIFKDMFCDENIKFLSDDKWDNNNTDTAISLYYVSFMYGVVMIALMH